ncbi:uncharacterized protein B0I36DRAFT_327656 [Microdochium trichocladiopsis]|uniref:Uncharacterized protein n=1 Tax=Microdochium trichocladiopsis TaxID=1682393 RepID=A0A9P8Y1X4_9PEZI|nr:uncharacterized protein B0I36DRAFT_327656 [Microdochium trichocladiopsis]KAH7027690.1 hypothetical protein B0I36DRAFT_327656 [Microdochium trichocladiopsis]
MTRLHEAQEELTRGYIKLSHNQVVLREDNTQLLEENAQLRKENSRLHVSITRLDKDIDDLWKAVNTLRYGNNWLDAMGSLMPEEFHNLYNDSMPSDGLSLHERVDVNKDKFEALILKLPNSRWPEVP